MGRLPRVCDALLGLAADAERLAVRSDYGIYSAGLFINVAASHLKSGFLEILSANDNICWKTRQDLPTWVSDWSAIPRSMLYL